jgi:ATP-dependent Lon protease
VREKVLAAHRAGVKTVIIPKRNLKDLVDVPKKARNDLDIRPVEHLDEVLKIALLPPEPRKKQKKSATTSKTRGEHSPEEIDL